MVFCGNDEAAIGFIKTVRDAGFAVPRDVSVAGYDDIEYAALFEPALTTMRQPIEVMGRRAVELLAAQIGDSSGGERVVLSATLIRRGSSSSKPTISASSSFTVSETRRARC